jgi:hypothetical protein
MTPLQNSSQGPSDPDKALGIMRLIWGALLAGQLIFGAIVVVLIGMDMFDPAEPPLPWVLLITAAAVLVTAVPVALIVRRRIYNQGLEEETVKPQAYMTGNIVVWAAVESVTLLSLVGCIVSASLMPSIIPGVFAVALFLMLRPDGRAMRPGGGNPYRGE